MLATSCVTIRFPHDLSHENIPSSSDTNTFIPPVTLKEKSTNLFFLLFVVSIDRLPNELILHQHEQPYLELRKEVKSYEEYHSFVLDELYVEFEDHSRVDVIDPSLSVGVRTFPMKEKK